MALILGLSACSSDSEETPAADPSTSAPSQETTEETTEEPTSDSGESDQLVRELRTLFDLDEQDAQCFVTTFEEAGLSVTDLAALAQGQTPEGVDPSTYASASAEAVNCLDPEERDAFLAKSLELAPESTIRDGFVSSFLASAPPGVTEDQAGCVYDDLVAGGLDLAQLAAGASSPEVQSALQDAFEACGIG